MSTSNGNPTARVQFPGLDGSAFQHPLDREATNNLKALAGFDKLVAKFLELRYERILYYYNLASSVKVGPRQFPRLYEMLRENCAILDVPEPELYVNQQQMVNAFTFGYTSPYIVIYTRLLDVMNDDEVRAVIAHELGHIKCGHVLYGTMANLIRDVLDLFSRFTFGLGGIVASTVEIALMDWRRRSELSADRAMLLAMQDLRPCVTLLTKLAGGTERLAAELDPDEFLRQAQTYQESDGTVLDMLYRTMAELAQGNHPFAVERVKEIDAWSRGAQYAQILGGDYDHTVGQKIQIKVTGR